MFNRLTDSVDYLYLLRACWRLGERRKLFTVVTVSFLGALAGLTQPFLQGHFIGAFVGTGSELIHNVMQWLIFILAAAAIGEVMFRQSWISESKYGTALEQQIIVELYRKTTSLPWRWHKAHHSADVTKRINDASSAITQFASNLANFWDIIFRFFGSLIAISVLSPWLTLVILVWLPFVNVPVSKLNRRQSEARQRQITASRAVSTLLTDYIGNIGTVLSLRLQEHTRSELSERVRQSLSLDQLCARIVSDRGFLISFSQSLFSFAITIAYLLLNTEQSAVILVSGVVALQGYLSRIEQSVHNFGWLQQYSMTSRAQLKSADEIETAYAELVAANQPTSSSDWHNMCLSHLTFRYEDQQHHVHQLQDVSLDLHRGQRVALVGSSGSGKSTLLRLMRGLHDPASGSLEIDGAPAEFSTLANLSTLVLQDAEIFENTLAYNIAFGMEAQQADLDRAIHAACLAPVLETLPQGLATDIRERGVNLSGGQKQRLALARGLYAGRDSTLLLLDEPTSSLDTVTEAQIFDRLFAGRPDACIVASLHRLHLLDRFDHVYVMDQGRVVEQGTFTALMGANGRLAQLWQAQKQEETAS